MFADDTLIFLKALVQNSRNLVHLLNPYCNASGQQVNFSKSTLYFSSNTPGNICEEICGVFSMSEVDDPRKYLGLPTIWGRAKCESLLYIKERILLKIQGWKQQLLSQASHEVLIKAVAQAVPQYPMNIFLFPKSEYDHIHGRAPSSSLVIDPKIWKLVWSLEAPPKICNFLWKALRNCLATKENMFRRKISSSPICPICCNEIETVEHMLLLCTWVAPIWFGGQLNMRIDKFSISTFANLLLTTIGNLPCSPIDSCRTISIIAFTCWHIWKLRCKISFEQSRPSPDIAIRESQIAYAEFTNAQIHKNVIHRPPPQNISPTQRWMPPCNDFVKVNVDASWKQGMDVASVGVIIRGVDGSFRAGFSGPTNASSLIEAETLAILEGYKFALHEGLNNVIIESDSRKAISSVHGSIARRSWQLYPLLKTIQ
ncbi:unnamed protein product [Prunus brigantina]